LTQIDELIRPVIESKIESEMKPKLPKGKMYNIDVEILNMSESGRRFLNGEGGCLSWRMQRQETSQNEQTDEEKYRYETCSQRYMRRDKMVADALLNMKFEDKLKMIKNKFQEDYVTWEDFRVYFLNYFVRKDFHFIRQTVELISPQGGYADWFLGLSENREQVVKNMKAKKIKFAGSFSISKPSCFVLSMQDNDGDTVKHYLYKNDIDGIYEVDKPDKPDIYESESFRDCFENFGYSFDSANSMNYQPSGKKSL
jgi:hypothetical protein